MSNPSAPSKFIPDSSIQYAWDSTSLQSLISCPRRYYYEQIVGYQSRRARIELEFGILFHKGPELYDRYMAAEEDDPSAHPRVLVQVVCDLLELMRHDYPSLRPEVYDGDGSPVLKFLDNTRTPATLIRAVTWYLENGAKDASPSPIRMPTAILPSGKAAAELSFRYELDDLIFEGQPYLLSGHLDRLVQHENGKTYFTDYKSTKQSLSSDWFSRFNLSIQMDGYSFGARVALGMPVAGGFIEGIQLSVGHNTFETGLIHRTDDELAEALDTFKTWMRMAQGWALEADESSDPASAWPMNKMSCFLCQFKRVCGSAPRIRPALLRAHFEKKEVWNPLKAR